MFIIYLYPCAADCAYSMNEWVNNIKFPRNSITVRSIMSSVWSLDSRSVDDWTGYILDIKHKGLFARSGAHVSLCCQVSVHASRRRECFQQASRNDEIYQSAADSVLWPTHMKAYLSIHPLTILSTTTSRRRSVIKGRSHIRCALLRGAADFCKAPMV